MKLWTDIIAKGLSYKEVKDWMEKLDCYTYATREPYNEFHMISKGNYYIVRGDHNIIKNPKDIKDTDKNDWMIVNIRDVARDVLMRHEFIKRNHIYTTEERIAVKERYKNSVIIDGSNGRRRKQNG